MAIIDCDECGNEVSDKAVTCPHCGAKVKKKMRPVEKFLAATLSVLVFLVFFSAGSEDGAETQTTAEKSAPEPECTTRQCIADEYMGYAVGPCKREVERRAKYGVEWDDGFLVVTLSGYKFDESGKIISYFGDKVRFQNGFGAWSNMVYQCDFDTETESLIAVDVMEGRL